MPVAVLSNSSSGQVWKGEGSHDRVVTRFQVGMCFAHEKQKSHLAAFDLVGLGSRGSGGAGERHHTRPQPRPGRRHRLRSLPARIRRFPAHLAAFSSLQLHLRERRSTAPP